MSPWHIVLREIVFRKTSAMIAIAAVAIAVASAVAILSLLRAHEADARALAARREQKTLQRMQDLQDSIHGAMDGLGFNVSLVPEGQDMANWLSADYGSKRMPYAHVEKLRAADLVTLDKPTAQLRLAMEWPETQWRIIVAGTEGRIDGQARGEMRGVAQQIPSGTVWLGHEIWRGLNLNTNATLTIAEQSFRAGRRLPQEGSRDDITVWMPLADAQKLFDEPDAINEIVAVGTRAAWEDASAIDRDVDRILPGLQTIVNAPKIAATLRARQSAEREALAMTRLEAATRAQLIQTRKRLALLLNGLMAVICGAWIGLLAYGNARDRNVETGLWSAMGMPRRRMVFLLSSKWTGLCLVGALLGTVVGQTVFLVARPEPVSGAEPGFYGDIAGAALILTLALAVLTSGIPARIASSKDPSIILREEMT